MRGRPVSSTPPRIAPEKKNEDAIEIFGQLIGLLVIYGAASLIQPAAFSVAFAWVLDSNFHTHLGYFALFTPLILINTFLFLTIKMATRKKKP
jgi:hypothetical protein